MMLTGCHPAPQSAIQPKGELAARPGTKETNSPAPEAKEKTNHADHVTLTVRAAEKVREIMLDRQEKYLRVSVSPEYQYQLEVVDRMDPAVDYLAISEGVSVLVDRKSSAYFAVGTAVDFVEENGRTGFKFILPESGQGPPETARLLVDARRGFKTTLARQESDKTPSLTHRPRCFELCGTMLR